MIRKSFLTLGNLFWEGKIMVFKGKHKHTLTYTHPISDVVKQILSNHSMFLKDRG